MADVLGLLREYHSNNKPIVENQGEILFGEFAWPKTAKTNYLIFGTGKDGAPKDYYTLECIVYLLRNIELSHSQYVRQAATAQVPVVRFPDRRDLLAYLKGETSSAANIDRTVPVDISIRRPVSKSSFDSQNIRRADHLDLDGQLEYKRARFGSYQPIDEQLSGLSRIGDALGKEDLTSTDKTHFDQGRCSDLPKAIPPDKIQSLRAKFRAKQQQAFRPDAIVQESPSIEALADYSLNSSVSLQPFTDSLSVSASVVGMKDPTYIGPNSQKIITIDDQLPVRPTGGDGTSSRDSFLSADLEIVRVISSRERRWRTRTTILQSQGKTFYENIVLGILRNVMLKENAHLVPDHRSAGLGGAGRNLMNASDISAYAQGSLAAGNLYGKSPIVMGSASAAQGKTGPLVPTTASGATQMQYSRYDQERFATVRDDTAGFHIDTMGTYHGKALASMVGTNVPAPDMTPLGAGSAAYNDPPSAKLSSNNDLQRERPETPGTYGFLTPRDPRGFSTPVAGMTPDPYRSVRSNDLRLMPRPKPRSSRVPIIIIPAAPTSLITMLNAQDILQDLRFITNEDKRNQGCKRENEILIHRQKPDGRTVPYRVIDQPNKLQSDEWNRVVAVFVQGQAWQFKGWPIGSDPAIIFSMLKGFHLKYTNMPLDANVAKWNVHVINLDRRRHLDKVNFQGVWDQLDKHIAKYKPFLRS